MLKSGWPCVCLFVCLDAPLAGKVAALVGLEGPLKVILQCLLQNEGMEVRTSHWSSDSLQKQVQCSQNPKTLGDPGRNCLYYACTVTLRTM